MPFSLACALSFLLLPLPVRTLQAPNVAQTLEKTWSLAPRWTSGQVTRYQTQTSFDLTFHTDDKEKLETTFQFGTDATLRYVVKKSESDGGLQVSVTSDGGKITDISGDTRDVPKEPANYPRLVTLNRWGTLRKLEDEGKNGKAANPLESVFDLTNLLVQLHFLSFPDVPVKIGDTWTAKYPLPTIGKSEKSKGTKPDEKEKPEAEARNIEAKYTLLGATKIGELDTLKISQEATVPYTAMTDALGNLTLDPTKKAGSLTLTLTFKMVALILPETGQVLQTSGVAEGEMKLEGTLAKQLPGGQVTFAGKIIALRLANKK